jgi:hypothetical protein
MAMVRSIFIQLSVLLLAVILVFTSISCMSGSGGIPKAATTPAVTGSQMQLINNIGAATNDMERTTALQKVVAAGYSLGITDAKGNQLNSNIAPDAVSLASGDIAALNYLTAEGQGRIIGSVVDYLAGAGVVLTSTKKLITFNDFQPDLQKYINWSFQNPKDPKAVLGMLLSSGADMKTPASPPVFTENTIISPTASMMMLADILLGVQAPAKPSSRGLFRKAVYAADVKDTAIAIQGLLTIVEPVLEKNGISIPEYAKKLIASFAAGNNFAVRIVDTLSLVNRSPVVVRQVQLGAQKGQTRALAVVVVLVPSGEILQEIPVNFSINLLSSASGGGGAAANLYPDADAILYTEGVRASIELNGHRMGIVGKEPGSPAAFAVVRGLVENKEPRTALLYAMATINAPDLGLIVKKYNEIIDNMGAKSIMLEAALPMEKVVEFYQTMQQGLKISASICKVTLSPKAGVVSIDPAALEGEIGQEYTFTAKLDPPKSATVFWFTDMLPTDTLPSSGAPGVEEADTKKVKWDRAGTYSVSAGAYIKDDQGNWILASTATAKVVILSKTSKLNISFQVGGMFSTLESLSFSGKTSEPKWPGNIEWVWDWGDGTAKYVTTNSPNASHRFTQPGTYSVLFTVRDGPTKEELGSFQYEVIISDLNVLQTMKALTINAWGYYTEESGAMKNGVFTKTGSSSVYTGKGGGNSAFSWPLTWKGYNCTARYDEKLATGQTRTWTIEGTVSTDTLTLLTATITIDYLDNNYQGTGKYYKTHQKLTVKNVPLTSNRSAKTFWGKVEGTNTPNSYVIFEYETILQDGRGAQGDSVLRFVNFDWNNTSQGIPKIQAEFKKE